ncbi:MAG: cyclic nucleotide-binding domain-containing protein [Acidimicrobiia bacterium]|nr:cyclic nucleotide-binding domain-containing protein [Acidimicrobiia bacterium]
MNVLHRRSDRIDMLKKVSLFSNLSKKDLTEVAKRADEVHVPKGTVLAEQGEQGSQGFIIVRGTVSVRRNNRKISTHGEGEVLGEMSLLDGKPRSASLRVESDAVLLVIHRRDFQYLVDHLPGLDRKILVSLSARLRSMDKALDH